MKTTLDLPDELMREVKLRAVEENRKLKDTVAELLRCGLAQDRSSSSRRGRRIQFPVIEVAQKASPEEEMTPERLAEILIEQEAEWQRDLMR